MRQNFHALKKKFPGLYRQDLMEKKLEELGLSQLEVARRAKIAPGTVGKIFAGRATQTKAYPVAVEVLGLDWRDVHDLNRPLEELGQAA